MITQKQANCSPLFFEEERQLQQRLLLGNIILVMTFIVAISSISIAFVFESHFSLGVQIAAHISIILCSITLKIGYLLRSFALKKRGSNRF